MPTVTLKERMLADRDLHKKITRRPSRRPSLALATEANTITSVDARGHFNRQGFGFFYQPLTATRDAGIRNGLSATPTLRTGLLNLKKALLGADLARAAATSAGHRAATRLGAAAVARFAVL
jgi:hypothetical protein